MMAVHGKLVRHLFVTVHSEVGRLQESDNLCPLLQRSQSTVRHVLLAVKDNSWPEKDWIST